MHRKIRIIGPTGSCDINISAFRGISKVHFDAITKSD